MERKKKTFMADQVYDTQGYGKRGPQLGHKYCMNTNMKDKDKNQDKDMTDTNQDMDMDTDMADTK